MFFLDTVFHNMNIASNFNIEDKSEFDFSTDEKVDNFIDSLPKIQKNILLMRMENVPADNIKQKLNISDKEYSSAMKSIKSYEVD